MKNKCKSCPFFLSYQKILEDLKEVAFWAKFMALHKEDIKGSDLSHISQEVRKIDALLKLCYPSEYASVNSENPAGDKKN
jgi:hypothetical protein